MYQILDLVSPYLSEEVREIIGTIDLTNTFSSTSLRGLHHYRVADLLRSLAIETYSYIAYMQVYKVTFIRRYKVSITWHAYFQAIFYILYTAKLIHITRNIDDSLLLVALCPLYCQTWERQTATYLVSVLVHEFVLYIIKIFV